MMGKHIKVESTMLKSVAHDPATETLEAEYTNGQRYRYEPVTTDGFADLLKAESVGKHFREHIINNIKGVKI
jgi:hypothetical protein